MLRSIKHSIWGLLLLSSPLFAQKTKLPVYGEVGLGIGQTLFGSATKAQLKQALGGGGFDPGTGQNISMGFYVAPENWRGLGIGSRIRGTFGSPVDGSGGDSYIFNYYNLAVSAKYYPLGQFSKGLYGRGSFGFGQFTSKRLNEESASKTYVHQYALGTSLMAGAGYTIPLRNNSLSIEAEWETSSRNGTVDKVGEVNFRSGQLGVNVIFGF